MIIIKCAKCKEKIFKYNKIGRGRLWHCWKDRINEDLSVHDGVYVKCSCGNLVGIDEEKWIKLKQHSIILSGTKTW